VGRPERAKGPVPGEGRPGASPGGLARFGLTAGGSASPSPACHPLEIRCALYVALPRFVSRIATVFINVPGGAQQMVLRWRLYDAGNDWYCAIDAPHVEVESH